MGGGRGLRSPFLNIEKSALILKNDFNCFHPWVKCFTQNVVLKVSRRKSSKSFPCGVFFLVFLTNGLSKCPNSTKSPLSWSISGCAPGKRVKNFSLCGSKILQFLLWTGQIKNNNLLLNIDIDSEFLMFTSKVKQSFRVDKKKRIIKTISSTAAGWYMVAPCSNSYYAFWN